MEGVGDEGARAGGEERDSFLDGVNPNPNPPPHFPGPRGESRRGITSKFLWYFRGRTIRIRSMQKPCSRCSVAKPLTDFNRRALSKDGRTAACAACIRATQQTSYWIDPNERARASARATGVKQRRFVEEPGYRRAFYMWGDAKRRTKIPSVMSITDFVPICKKADAKGAGYVLDHIVPLRHPQVCGLHVPWNLRVVKRRTNTKKGSKFVTDWPTE